MRHCTVLEADVGGLSVVTAGLPWARSCAGAIEVGTGFGDDPYGREGLAHLCEHLATATATRRHGIRLGGRTDVSTTRYSTRARPVETETLVRSLLSVLGRETYDPALYGSEIQAIRTENARVRDEPRLRIAGAVAALSFPESDVAIADTSSATSLAAIGADDVAAFRRRAYRPANAALTIVGAGEAEALLDQVRAAAAQLSAGPAEAGRDDAPGREPDPERRRRTEGRDPSWDDCLLWTALSRPTEAEHVNGSGESPARRVAVELLVGTPGLLDDLAAGQSLRSTGFAGVPGRRADLLVVAWPSGPGTEGLAALLAEPAARPELWSPGPRRIADARERVRTRVALDQQSPAGLAGLLLAHAMGRGPWPDLEAFGAVSDEAVTAEVRRILGSSSLCRISDGKLSRWEG